jgi:hypothetical protein
MKIFQVNEHISFVCDWAKTRSGFKHVATFVRDGREQAKVKICYYNRTWESYEYQSVLQKLAGQIHLTEEEHRLVDSYIKNYKEDDSFFNTIGLVASLGSILCDTKKEQNDWKTRMIKAGLGNMGLDIPADWDTLTEEEKEKRLNSVIGVLAH